jgi:hypothetical protein
MAKGRVRPVLVAVPAAGLDHAPCFGHGVGPVQVQVLVSQRAVEPLDKGLLGRLARPGEVDANLAPVRPQSTRGPVNSDQWLNVLNILGRLVLPEPDDTPRSVSKDAIATPQRTVQVAETSAKETCLARREGSFPAA